MKMLVEKIVIPLIFRRQLEMGVDPTSVIIEPRPKISGSGSSRRCGVISQRPRKLLLAHCTFRHFDNPDRKKYRKKGRLTSSQSEWSFSEVLFLSQSEKSPESGIFTCDPTKKCIMPSSRERHKGIIGRGHDLRLTWLWRQDLLLFTR